MEKGKPRTALEAFDWAEHYRTLDTRELEAWRRKYPNWSFDGNTNELVYVPNWKIHDEAAP